MGHEINSGDDNGNPNKVGTSWGRSHKRPQVSRGSESELDEKIDLAAAANTVVGKCRDDES
jgi:hypothetical protein